MAKAKSETLQIAKAQVSLPAPGVITRFSSLGPTVGKRATDTFSYARRQQYGIYYDMYLQHPVVRACIDKKAAYLVAGGVSFVVSDPNDKLSPRKQAALQTFFRRSASQQLMRLTYKDIDIYGEAFWLIVRSQAGTPMKALRLNPRYMEPLFLPEVGFFQTTITQWKYGPVTSREEAKFYDAGDVLHFKIDDPEDDSKGISPLHPLQSAVAQDLWAMAYNESFFKNSAQTGVIFVVKQSTGDEAKRNREWIEANYVGAENAHRPLLIEGDVTVAHSVSTPAEMEFLEGRKFLRQEILMTLEMDPDKIGIHEHSNRSVSKEMEDQFRSQTIWPRQQILEEEINNKLIQSIFGYSDILITHNEGDPRLRQDQSDIYDKNLKSGRQTLNEQRKEMGLPEIEGGSIAWIMTPTGIILVSSLVEAEKNGGMVQPGIAGQGAQAPGTANNRNQTMKTPLSHAAAQAVSQKET